MGALSRPEEVVALVKLRVAAGQIKRQIPSEEHWAFCYSMLQKVSRSFALVIQQLGTELRNAVCIFYLVLRALDTVEDDTSIPDEVKVPILQEFYRHIYNREWHYSCGTNNYRVLMDQFHFVSTAFLQLGQGYQQAIEEVTRKMGAGMAKFICKEVETVGDYDEYCHYVAGLVGYGLSRLFHAAGTEDLASDSLSNSMGLFLQVDRRRFGAVWGQNEPAGTGRVPGPERRSRKSLAEQCIVRQYSSPRRISGAGSPDAVISEMPPLARRRTTPCRHGGGHDVPSLLVFLLLPALLLSSAAHSAETRTLSVGRELFGETMPLRHGRRVYRVEGLRPSAWYEVKISYPASIPSSFSIRLVDDPDSAEDLGSKNRRLLNTEKIIFKAHSSDPAYVLVTVEPEGIVAKPNVPERELALFNIVCDELMLGIPHFAWWVGIGAVLCIVLALLAPLVLPLHKLLNYEPTELRKADTAKMS